MFHYSKGEWATHMNSRTLMRIFCVFPIASFALSSCVSGAPTLSNDQQHRLSTLAVYPVGQLPTKPYTVLAAVSSADCSGDPWHGRTYGNVDRALDTLKRKAAAMNADSIIEVSCGATRLINNCWHPQKCTGQAISFSGARASVN